MKQEEFVYVAPDGIRYEMDHFRTRPWWKSELEYLPIIKQHPSKIAWEFLRRNPKYCRKYYEWKWNKSQALDACVLPDHPLWVKEKNMAREIQIEFGIDPICGLPSPDFPHTAPIFIDQVFPSDDQYITTFESLVKKSDEFFWGIHKNVYFITPGESWPRRKVGPTKRRAHRRHQLINYLRLLDARAKEAPMELIRFHIAEYRKLPKEQAHKRIHAHWRAAKQMAMSGYRKLAASL